MKILSQECKQENELGCPVCRHFHYYELLYIEAFPVVWVPDRNIRKLDFTRTEEADQILDSLEEFIPEQWGLPPYDKL